LTELERATPQIKAELLPLLAELSPDEYEMQAGTIGQSFGKWKVYYIVKASEVMAEAALRCPRTAEAILRIPGRIQNSSLGYGMFSVLESKGHIKAHFGPVNIRRVH
jgi:aspartyl/asparaginyl beta-hydroxylase (cupin superfamily)